MAAVDFITGKSGDIVRNEFVVFIDVADVGSTTPDWEAVGYGVEDSSMEFDTDVTTIQDILGNTISRTNSSTVSQAFDPNTLRYDSKLSQKLWLDAVYNHDLAALSGYKALIVYYFAGAEGEFAAQTYDNCNITPERLGGSGYSELPFTITYGGNVEYGTVANRLPEEIVFTPN